MLIHYAWMVQLAGTQEPKSTRTSTLFPGEREASKVQEKDRAKVGALRQLVQKREFCCVRRHLGWRWEVVEAHVAGGQDFASLQSSSLIASY